MESKCYVRGKRWGELDADPQALGMSYFFVSTMPTYSHKTFSGRNQDFIKTSWLSSCLEYLCLAIEETTVEYCFHVDGRVTYG